MMPPGALGELLFVPSGNHRGWIIAPADGMAILGKVTLAISPYGHATMPIITVSNPSALADLRAMDGATVAILGVILDGTDDPVLESTPTSTEE